MLDKLWDVLKTVMWALFRPPDVDDEKALVEWLDESLAWLGWFARRTKTTIDDQIVAALDGIVHDPAKWAVVYPLIVKLFGDGVIGDILDAEIGSLLKISDMLVAENVAANVAVVLFGSSAGSLDLGPAEFGQRFVGPQVDQSGNSIPDLEGAARTLVRSGVSLFRTINVGHAPRGRLGWRRRFSRESPCLRVWNGPAPDPADSEAR